MISTSSTAPGRVNPGADVRLAGIGESRSVQSSTVSSAEPPPRRCRSRPGARWQRPRGEVPGSRRQAGERTGWGREPDERHGQLSPCTVTELAPSSTMRPRMKSGRALGPARRLPGRTPRRVRSLRVRSEDERFRERIRAGSQADSDRPLIRVTRQQRLQRRAAADVRRLDLNRTAAALDRGQRRELRSAVAEHGLGGEVDDGERRDVVRRAVGRCGGERDDRVGAAAADQCHPPVAGEVAARPGGERDADVRPGQGRGRRDSRRQPPVRPNGAGTGRWECRCAEAADSVTMLPAAPGSTLATLNNGPLASRSARRCSVLTSTRSFWKNVTDGDGASVTLVPTVAAMYPRHHPRRTTRSGQWSRSRYRAPQPAVGHRAACYADRRAVHRDRPGCWEWWARCQDGRC